MISDNISHYQRQGAKIRAVANDIKRNDKALAEELGLSFNLIQQVFDGTASVEIYDLVINKMVNKYPISRLDLDIRKDDTDDGVIIQNAVSSKATKRIFNRADRTGNSTPYYEYRDAAMSSVGPYRPEWIKELRVVNGTDANNPDVAYNTGHLMHQNTFFVGPVNFYWKIGDTAFVEEMGTGDSNYITPFVPHSFASRDPQRDAYIVAVTFTGKLDKVHQDVMVLPHEGVLDSLFNFSDKFNRISALLLRELNIAMLNPQQLANLTGLKMVRISDLLNGVGIPSFEELQILADGLNINVRDLIAPDRMQCEQVVVRHAIQSDCWAFPSYETPRYEVKALAGSKNVPYLKSMDVKILELQPEHGTNPDMDLDTTFHEFGYNYGGKPVVLYWETHTVIRNSIIGPGDSYYIKPTVKHSLRSLSRTDEPTVVLMRVGGALYGDSHFELSSFPRDGVHRVLRETQQWYNPYKIGG